MIRFFELPMNREKIKKPIGHSLLQFLCFLVIVFSGLVPSESHSQTCPTVSIGDQVIVQNVTIKKGLAVRESHGKNETEEDRVHNNKIGIVKSNPVVDGIYTWYHVKWKGIAKPGWSAGIINGTKYIAEVSEVRQKDKIVKGLFGGENPERINPHKTNHDYNDYGCTVPRWEGQCKGYDGGHSGWDVQTHTVALNETADEEFYSLTAGVVTDLREGDFNTFSFIAIFDGQMTIFYLHAREISNDILEAFKDPDVKARVEVGTCLGIQGNTGLGTHQNDTNTAEHVHIEVRKGEHTGSACGAVGSINPIPCLYRWTIGARKKQFLPWDVNQNRKVNWEDKLLVDINRWGNNPWYDVNCDGTVDRKDVDEIDKHIGDPSPAAPAISTHNQIAMTPNKTTVLPNYPNPFNPETWIPYELSKPTEVTVTIYKADGRVARTLVLGHQPAGVYQDKSRAAYWDGKNEFGESVASGIYFYTLKAGEFTATRKMLIRK